MIVLLTYFPTGYILGTFYYIGSTNEFSKLDQTCHSFKEHKCKIFSGKLPNQIICSQVMLEKLTFGSFLKIVPNKHNMGTNHPIKLFFH